MSGPFVKVAPRSSVFASTGSDLASKVESFIDKHPTWLVYMRRDLRFPHADCYLSDSKSPDPNCEVCWGSGFKVQLEKHKTRRVIGARDLSSPLLSIGFTGEYAGIIYSQRSYYQQQMDIYFDVEWDVPQEQIGTLGRPTRIIQCWRVDETVMMKESASTYMACKVQQADFKLALLEEWFLTRRVDWVTF